MLQTRGDVPMGKVWTTWEPFDNFVRAQLARNERFHLQPRVGYSRV